MLEVRTVEISDALAIRDIYNHYVANSVVTFDLVPSNSEFWESKISHLSDKNLPFLVITENNQILGFTYVSPWREKAAYDKTVENTIYLHPQQLGRGLGKVLLRDLIDRSREIGIRQMIAVISAEGAEASISLCKEFGFYEAGRLDSVGFKFDRWLGTVLMQKAL